MTPEHENVFTKLDAEAVKFNEEHMVRDRIEELIGEMDSMFLLNGVQRLWEMRMKKLAAEVLKPGTDEIIDEFNGGLDALNYIWHLHGDYCFSSGDKEPPKFRALDYYVGRKISHIWGTGVLVKTKNGYGIRVRLPCATEKCKGLITVYMGPGCHNGAFCYAYDRDGKYLADLRNQWFVCNKCQS